MEARNSQPVTIVGAGIVGICCALSLLEKGFPVRLIDRDEPGSGASNGNAGVISPWSCVPQSMPDLWKNIPKLLFDRDGPVSIIPSHFPRFLPWLLRFLLAGRARRVAAISDAMSVLTRQNVDMYRRHLAGTGQENLLRDSWYIFVSRNSEFDFPDSLGWRLRRKAGAPMLKIDRSELNDIEPALSKEYQSAILIKDQARAVSPGRISSVLAEKVKSLGGTIIRCAVHRISPDLQGKWLIQTDNGEEITQCLVVAAGAWSARLLAPLNIKIPLEAERGYHVAFPDPGVALNNSVADMDMHVVSSSMEEGLRTAGTAEFAELDAKPNYKRAKMLVHQTKNMIPDLNTDETDFWMGIRPSFPDSLPCIGEVKGYPGLIAAFGHSHYGLGMAPMTGWLAAEIVSGGKPDVDMVPYDIHRFSS